jgi:hypothetical protein
MYIAEVWDYDKQEELLEALITKLRENKRIVVLFDPDFPTGRAVFHLGEYSELNIQEAKILTNTLNNFHYNTEV